MPIEREEVRVITTTPTMRLEDMDEAQLSALEGKDPSIPEGETRAQRKARLVDVLSRGVVNDILTVDAVPLDKYHYEWVRADPLQVQAMRAKGFWIDTEYANKRAIHSDGSSGNQVGDVVCMITDRENYEVLQEIAADERKRFELGGRTAGNFQGEVNRATDGDIPTTLKNEQRVRPLKEVMAEMQDQTRISGA